MLFATPMCLLFYIGIFAGYLLVLHRENRKFPWKKAMTIVIPGTARASFSAIPGHYQVWYETGTTLAIFNPIKWAFL